jgi:hypothetical protein
LQRFRCKTLLIFHDTGAKRAFGDSPAGRISARSAPGGEAAAKRAEREKLAPLGFSRDCVKFRTACPKRALICNTSGAERC